MNQLISSYVPSKQNSILRRLLEAYHQRQLSLLAISVDFSKAFDSVDRNALFKILRILKILKILWNSMQDY